MSAVAVAVFAQTALIILPRMKRTRWKSLALSEEEVNSAADQQGGGKSTSCHSLIALVR